jgi:hypothetical protein
MSEALRVALLGIAAMAATLGGFACIQAVLALRRLNASQAAVDASIARLGVALAAQYDALERERLDLYLDECADL